MAENLYVVYWTSERRSTLTRTGSGHYVVEARNKRAAEKAFHDAVAPFPGEKLYVEWITKG